MKRRWLSGILAVLLLGPAGVWGSGNPVPAGPPSPEGGKTASSGGFGKIPSHPGPEEGEVHLTPAEGTPDVPEAGGFLSQRRRQDGDSRVPKPGAGLTMRLWQRALGKGAGSRGPFSPINTIRPFAKQRA